MSGTSWDLKAIGDAVLHTSGSQTFSTCGYLDLLGHWLQLPIRATFLYSTLYRKAGFFSWGFHSCPGWVFLLHGSHSSQFRNHCYTMQSLTMSCRNFEVDEFSDPSRAYLKKGEILGRRLATQASGSNPIPNEIFFMVIDQQKNQT